MRLWGSTPCPRFLLTAPKNHGPPQEMGGEKGRGGLAGRGVVDRGGGVLPPLMPLWKRRG